MLKVNGGRCQMFLFVRGEPVEPPGGGPFDMLRANAGLQRSGRTGATRSGRARGVDGDFQAVLC